MRHSFYRIYGKRLFDFFAAFIGLIALSFLLIFIAICVKLTSKGPVFFVQKRLGKDFKPFNMIKFRSMVVSYSLDNPLVTSSKNSRITAFGGFLRRYKLDELPQLFNVIKGDMALVGPRPEVERYINHYKDDYNIILSVRPGITDNAAIQFSNEESLLAKYDDVEDAYINKVLPQKIELYKEYIENIRFFNDVNLILKTIFG